LILVIRLTAGTHTLRINKAVEPRASVTGFGSVYTLC